MNGSFECRDSDRHQDNLGNFHNLSIYLLHIKSSLHVAVIYYTRDGLIAIDISLSFNKVWMAAPAAAQQPSELGEGQRHTDISRQVFLQKYGCVFLH